MPIHVEKKCYEKSTDIDSAERCLLSYGAHYQPSCNRTYLLIYFAASILTCSVKVIQYTVPGKISYTKYSVKFEEAKT